MLYVVATPIGNLEDITLRALRILGSADVVLCEDTRVTKHFLHAHGIDSEVRSFHAHSSLRDVEKILEMLQSGKTLALVSDAGTPGISDPAYVLVQRTLQEEIEVVPIPGPAAFLTALMAGGVPTNHFLYLGFLPLKKGRKTLLDSFETMPYTVVFYESKHRILKTLSELAERFPDRYLSMGRELTKLHETFYRGTTLEVMEKFNALKEQHKGEFVLMLAPDGWEPK